MKFKLVCEHRELVYDSSEHTLNVDGNFESYNINIEHHCGDGGRGNITIIENNNRPKLNVVKLLLGLNCNYKCVYCNQDEERTNDALRVATRFDIKKTKQVFKEISKKYNFTNGTLELWGGEPLVYKKIIFEIAPYIRELFPNIAISIITNGSLLDEPFVDFCIENKIGICVSHDAMSQTKFRNSEDILDNKEIVECIRKLHSNNLFYSFHFVITEETSNLFDAINFFHKKMEYPFPVSTEGIVKNTRLNMDYIKPFTEEGQATLIECMNIIGKEKDKIYLGDVDKRLRRFISTLNSKNGIEKSPYSCNDSSNDVLSIDCEGNVLACHTVPYNIASGAGNVLRKVNLENRNKQFKIWSERETNCAQCVSFQICNGGCGIVSNEEHKLMCNNKWLEGVSYLSAMVGRLFGERLLRIEPYYEEAESK